jgi:hypothetical protein
MMMSKMALSQSTDNIPYSRIGMGDILNQNNFQNTALGGLGAAMHHSLYLNFSNPASYTSLNFTNFEFGLRTNYSILNSDTTNARTSDASIAHFAVGMPFTKKGGIAFGALPYSHVGYNIFQTYNDAVVGKYNIRYEGKGNTYQLFLGAGYKVMKGLSIGANVYYMLGNVNYNQYSEFTDTTLISNTEKLSKINIRGTQLKLGLQYEHLLSDSNETKRSITLGATYNAGSKLKTSTDNQWMRFNYNALGGIDLTTNYKPDTLYKFTKIKGSITLPQSFSVGLVYTKLDYYTVGINLQNTQWKNYRKDGKADLLSNEIRLGAGFEYIPDIKSLKGYTKKIAYRFGASYSTGKWELSDANKTKISETSFNFGMGFPLKKIATRVNTGVEIGMRGINDATIIRETFVRLHFGISMNDRWFIKPRIE